MLSLTNTLRGGGTFWQLYLAIIIGFTAGILPTANVLFFSLFMLFLLLNVSGLMTLLAYSAGALLRIYVSEPLNQLGHLLLEKAAVAKLASATTHTPILALMGFDQVNQWGSVPVIFLVCILAAPICSTLHTLRERRRPEQLGWLLRHLLEKQSGIRRAYRSASLLSIHRLFAGSILLLCAYPLTSLVLEQRLRHHIQETLYHLNGSLTGIGAIHVQLTSGTVHIDNVTIQHKDAPDYYTLWAKKIKTDLDKRALLSGQLRFNNMTIEGAWIDYPLTDNAQQDHVDAGIDARVPARQATRLTPDHYAPYGETLQTRLNALGTLLADDERRRQRQEGTQNSVITSPQRPQWVIPQILLYDTYWHANVPHFDIAIYNLSSHPSQHEPAVGAAVSINQTSFIALRKSLATAPKKKRDALKELQKRFEGFLEAWL